MGDFTSADPVGKDNFEKKLLQEGLSELTELGLKDFLNNIVDTENREAAEAKYASAVAAELALRKTNEKFVQRLDNAMRHGAKCPASTFREPGPLIKPLLRGEKRRVVDVLLGDGEQGPLQKRMQIEGPTGNRWVCPRLWDDSPHIPAIHMTSDNGSVGRPGVKFLLYSYNARATHRSDLAHNIISAKTNAESDVGLAIIRVEYKGFLSIREGPHKPGGANHGILKGVSIEFFNRLTYDSVLFTENFEDIVRANDWGALDHGSVRHRKEVHERCKICLLKAGKTCRSKDGRWWNYECKTRGAKGTVPIYRMLLQYMGLRKKWWPDVSQCPLFFDDAPMSSEVPDDMVLEEFIALAQGDDVVDAAADLFAAGPADAAVVADDAIEDDALEAAPIDVDAEVSGEQADGGDDGPSATRVTRSQAWAEARKRRAKTENNFKFNAKIVSRRLNVSLWQSSCHVPIPVEKWFNKVLLPGVKTRRGGAQLQVDLSNGQLGDVSVSVLAHVLSSDFAETLALTPKAGNGV